ncbi:hypothetical protein [Shewanella xiamenensis]|uniref:hypothetical protein n=1 Tax=Shewanella xiamenensis TaxID=332186 RepID=UPI002E7C4A45|nr:hypothetical protein [Shewanella xiamenensis]MEE1981467.1 hypothetical protein [Shewanella xiamenensis]
MKVSKIANLVGLAVISTTLIACSNNDDKKPTSPLETNYKYARTTIAPVDEIYYGRAHVKNEFAPYKGLTDEDAANDLLPAKARRNAAYAWGVAEYGNEVWFGSLNNGWCGWMMKHLKLPIYSTAFDSEIQACNLVDISRPGQLYIYDVAKGKTEVIDPSKFNNAAGQNYAHDIATGPTAIKDGQYVGEETKTYGFRSAGQFDGIVFFVGHANLSQDAESDAAEGFLRLFAFNAETRTYLGKADFPYDSVRRMTILKHPDGSQALYTFMGPDTSLGQAGTAGTVGLRWVGTKEAPLTGGDLHGFEVVTTADFKYEGLPGEFVQTPDEKGSSRLVVTTWAHPKLGKVEGYQGGRMLASNPMPQNGFSKADPINFEMIFSTDDYEVDANIAKGYEMGAMTMHNGYLYFGTMHVGHSGGYDKVKQAFPDAFPTVGDGEFSKTEQELSINSWRASSLFRMKMDKFLTPEQFKPELLYGYDKMWTFDGNVWAEKPNKLGLSPKFGPAGWGEPLNVYAWTAVTHNDKVYFGSFDLGSGIRDYYDLVRGVQTPQADERMQGLETKQPDVFCMAPNTCIGVDMIVSGKSWFDVAVNNPMFYIYEWAMKQPGAANKSGADLIVFEDLDNPAKVITYNGFGNSGNNGIRNASIIDGELYFGTSTYSNLGSNSGFEFYKVTEEQK